ncbi:hypothetical protein B296_00050749, partial [Ensete ventricosum]
GGSRRPSPLQGWLPAAKPPAGVDKLLQGPPVGTTPWAGHLRPRPPMEAALVGIMPTGGHLQADRRPLTKAMPASIASARADARGYGDRQ